MRSLIKWGGIAALVVGAVDVAKGIVMIFAPGHDLFSSSDYLREALVFISFLGILVVLAALNYLQRESSGYGWLGKVGFTMACVGTLVGLSRPLVLLFLEGIRNNDLDTLIGIGAIASFLGLILLGAATLRARVLPLWCGLLILLGFPAPVFLGPVLRDLLIGNIFPPVASMVQAAIWASVGYALLKVQRRDSASPYMHRGARTW